MSNHTDDNIPAARYRISRIDTYEVAVSDFDRIEEVASTVGSDLTFATTGLSVAVTLTITLAVSPISNEHLHTEFFIVMCFGYGAALYCGFRWWRQRGELKKLVDRIRKMQVGPLGEQGKEIKPSDLANMPLEAAPTPAISYGPSAKIEEVRESVTEVIVAKPEPGSEGQG